jgi:uncharacterized protein (DUF433 family)
MAKGALVQLHDDPRDTPIYSVMEASYHVGVPRGTLRHWLKAPTNGRAIIETPAGDELSFYNLLEAHVLRVAIERKVLLPKLRQTVELLRERMPGVAHPLLEHHGIATAQRGGFHSLFSETLGGQIEDLGHHGQLVFDRLIRKYLSRIDEDASGPVRFRPMNFQHVALDHRVAGGRPVVLDTGILVEMIARRHRAGETVQFLADDFGISKTDVREAIKYAA